MKLELPKTKTIEGQIVSINFLHDDQSSELRVREKDNGFHTVILRDAMQRTLPFILGLYTRYEFTITPDQVICDVQKI